MRSRWIRSLGWLIALAAWPSAVLAEPRAVVSDFKGSSGKSLRSAVVDVLEEHSVELVPPKKAEATARSSGAELDTESGRVRVAKKLHLQAFIEGKTQPGSHKRIQIVIKVYGGNDGMPAAEYSSTVAKTSIARDLKAHLWNAIGKALSESDEGAATEVEEVATPAPVPVKRPAVNPPLQPQVAAAPKRPAPPARPAAQEQAEDRETPPGIVAAPPTDDEALALEAHPDQEEERANLPPPLDLSVGARVGTRSFGYNDSLPGLRGYSLGPSPSLALQARWYPAAHFTGGVLANIGLDVRGEMLVGVSSENSSGQKFSTNSHAFGLGLRGRVPLGALEMGAVVGFGQHAFGMSDANKIDPDVPDIVHNFIRAGLEGRYQLIRPLAVQLRASYLFGLSLGELAAKAWFPHATGDGIEAELSFQLSITRTFGVELAAGLERYFMSLNPEPTDPGVRGTARVAGGALDKYYSSRFGLIIRL